MRPGIGFLAVGLVLFPGCFSKVGFPKDQKMDVLFPPYIVPAGHGIPDGHLRPLGKYTTHYLSRVYNGFLMHVPVNTNSAVQ